MAADARSPREARRFLTSTLGTWGDEAYGDDALLLLSELVTNAALHAKTEIVVRVALTPLCLRLEVTDGSPRQPVVRHYSDQSTTGRGLGLINSLARRWGISPHPDGSKTVWAELTSDFAQRSPRGTTVDLAAFPTLGEEGPGSAQKPGSPEETTTSLRAA